MTTERQLYQLNATPIIWRAADLSYRVEIDGGFVLARNIPNFYDARRIADALEPAAIAACIASQMGGYRISQPGNHRHSVA